MAGTISNGKSYVLNGVGTAYINITENGLTRSVPCGTLQKMQLSFSGSLEKIYGSDSLQPIYLIDQNQEVKVSFTEARFNLDWMAVTNGAKMDNIGEIIFNVAPTLIATGTAFTVPGSLTTIVPADTIVTLSDDAAGLQNLTVLSYDSSATPGTGKFNITAAGVITLGESVTNKYISVNGIYTDAISRAATVTTTSLPGFVSIRHISHPVDMGDGVKVTMHTQIFRAKATGKLDIDHERQKAMAPQLEFEVFYDTTRTDGKIVKISQQLS